MQTDSIQIDYDHVREIIIDELQNMPLDITNGFYSGYKIAAELKKHPEIALCYIIGMRRIGKTELFTYLACLLYQKYGIKTAWVRNREIEFKKNYESFLNRMKQRDLIPPDWIVRPSGVYTDSGKHAVKVIDFMYLNTSSNMRGGGHPDTYMMILDEYQPEDLRYPPHPLTSLMSLTQTVLSGKSSLCFCLSNFVSLANPYFVGMEIYPSRRDVSVYPEKGTLVERCRGYKRAIEEDSPWQRVYNSAGYQSYASETEDGLLDLVCPPSKGAKAADQIVFCIHGRYYRRLSDGRIIYWIRTDAPRSSNVMILTPYPEDVTTVVHPCRLPAYMDMLQTPLAAGTVRFQSPNCLFDVMSPCYLV